MGVGLQIVLALAFTKIPLFQKGLAVLNDAVSGLTDATRAGTTFVFGFLGGGEVPWTPTGVGSSFIFAFQALPLILTISVLSALLFYWNIIPPVVKGFAWVLRRTIGIDGPAGVSTAMNIFVGMVEAPLVIRPYLRSETRSGMFVIMTGGMATVSGSVLVLYATMLEGVIPNPLGQLITASILAAPATIVISFIMLPPDPAALEITPEPADVLMTQSGDTTMSVITQGAVDGMQLLISVIAMLIVLVALVSLANSIIGWLPDVAGAPMTLQRIFGWGMSPLAWLMGVPWSEASAAGALLGTKTVLNELIAYSELSQLPPDALSVRSRLIMTYGLCGFANFSALGIMIGGLCTMVPERRADIVALAPRTLISGALATCMTGAVVGTLTWL